MPDFNQIDEAVNAFASRHKGRVAPVKHITEKASSGPLEITMPGAYNVYGDKPGFGHLFIRELTHASRWVGRMGTDTVRVYSFQQINVRGLEAAKVKITHAPPSNQLLVEVSNA